MPVILHDRSLLTGATDRLLSGAARTLRLSHDLLAKLIEAGRAGGGQSALDIGGFDFASRMKWRGLGGGCFKPERVGVERKQAWFLCGSVTELESKFDRGDMRRRPDQQEIGIPDGMKSAGAAESAADLIAADRFSNVVNL